MARGHHVSVCPHRHLHVLLRGAIETSRAHRDEGRRTVGSDVAQAYRELRGTNVDADAQASDDPAQQRDVLFDLPLDDRRDGVLEALIECEIGSIAVRTPHRRVHPLRRTPGDHDGIAFAPERAARPLELVMSAADPTTRPLQETLVGPASVLHEGLDAGVVLGPVLVAVQPVSPPAHLAGDPVDVRTGQHAVWPPVAPRSDDRPCVLRTRGDEAQDRVAVAVLPSADHEHGRSDRVRVDADRSVQPVLVRVAGARATCRSPARSTRAVRATARASSRPRRPDRGARRRTGVPRSPRAACRTRARCRPCSGRRRGTGRRSSTR